MWVVSPEPYKKWYLNKGGHGYTMIAFFIGGKMKKLYKTVSYFLVAIIVTLLLGSILSINSYAVVPDTMKAISHQGSWGTYAFDYSFHYKYWTIQDATGINTGSLSAPHYFYTDDNVTFFDINGADLIQIVLTRGIGIILNPDNAPALIQAFFAAITQHDTTDNLFVQGGVYDAQHNFLGYALNDITGCYYEGITLPGTQPAIDVPSETTNNVKNFYDYYTGDIPVDFFTFYPPSKEFIYNHLAPATNNQYNNPRLNFLNNALTDDTLTDSFFWSYVPNYSNDDKNGFINSSGWNGETYIEIPECYITGNGYDWRFNLLCNSYGLINDNHKPH